MAGVGFYPVPDSRWLWDSTQIVGLRLTLGNLVLSADLSEPELSQRGLDLLDQLLRQVTTGILQRLGAQVDEQPRVSSTQLDLCCAEQR